MDDLEPIGVQFVTEVWDWVHPDIDQLLRRALGLPVEDDPFDVENC